MIEQAIEEDPQRRFFRQQEKELIYAAARSLFKTRRLSQMLGSFGISQYVLYAVATMAPARVANRNADLDLALALNASTAQQLKEVAEALAATLGLELLFSHDTFGGDICFIRLGISSRQIPKGYIDVFVKSLNLRGNNNDFPELARNLYEMNRPMAILLSRRFSAPVDSERLLQQLLDNFPESSIEEKVQSFATNDLEADRSRLGYDNVDRGRSSKTEFDGTRWW